MNVPTWVAWIFVILLAIISFVVFIGKATFLIAGYNTLDEEAKSKYYSKRLSKVIGGGLGVITVITALLVIYDAELPTAIGWLNPWGILGTILIMLISANTVCRR